MIIIIITTTCSNIVLSLHLAYLGILDHFSLQQCYCRQKGNSKVSLLIKVRLLEVKLFVIRTPLNTADGLNWRIICVLDKLLYKYDQIHVGTFPQEVRSVEATVCQYQGGIPLHIFSNVNTCKWVNIISGTWNSHKYNTYFSYVPLLLPLYGILFSR